MGLLVASLGNICVSGDGVFWWRKEEAVEVVVMLVLVPIYL